MNAKYLLLPAILLTVAEVCAEPIDDAVNWLYGQQSGPGFANPMPMVSDDLASFRALSALVESEQIDVESAAIMLEPALYDISSMTTQELAHAWLAASRLGLPTGTWRQAVLTRQTSSGAFAKYPGSSADLLATMTVLEILQDHRGTNGSAFTGAFSWLFNQQRDDGAWYAGEPLRPSAFITARAARFFYGLRHEFNLTSTLTRSRQALQSLQQIDGLWGEIHATAAAVRFMLVDAPAHPDTAAALDNLLLQQHADGGFTGDTYSTAWALLALYQASRPAPPPDSMSELRGQVLSADTGGPLATVMVNLTGSDGSRQTVSNINGSFAIDELEQGSYLLSLSYPDHAPFEVELTIPFNQVFDIGQIQLFLGGDAQTLVVRGQVTGSDNDEPIADAFVQGGGLSATTDEDGRYQLLSVPPGELTLIATATGYYAATASLTGEAGMIVDFSPELTPGAGHHTGATLRGVITAEDTGLTISGATISVSGSNEASLLSQGDGGFETILPQPGPVRIVFSADDYHAEEWNTTVTAGGLIEYSPVLRPVIGPGPQGAGIRGRVVSAGNGQGIDGADVRVISGQTTRFVRTNSDGEFNMNELLFDTAILEVESPGYHPLRLSVAVPPQSVRDLGDIPIRPIRLEAYLPDLVVTDVDLTVTDVNHFDFIESISITVANRGSARTDKSFALMAFIDAADNGVFDPNLDVIVGSTRINGGLTIGEEKTAVIELEGRVNFRDAPIKVWIDKEQEVLELDDSDNIVSTALGCRIQPAPLTSDGIRERWRWEGYSGDSRIANVATTPLVVQLTDDNGDGVIDQHDIPDIVFVAGDRRNDSNPSQTRLIALSGDTGEELWAVDFDLSHYTQLAGADVNKDGFMNIVGVTRTRSQLVAVKHDGSLLWSTALGGPSRPTPLIPPWAWAGDYVSISNLEGDSEAQVIYGRRTFRGLDGSLLWEGERDHGGYLGGYIGENPIPIGDGLASYAADLNLDGDKQVIAGRTVYDRLGNVVWHREDLGSEYCDMNGKCASTSSMVAIGNFDEDDFAEIVMVIDGTMRVVNHDGTDLWGPIDLPDGEAGDVAIADLTRDGRPEIVVSQNHVLQVYRYNGDLLWTAPIEDPTGWVSVSIADINGNGWLEILHLDEANFRLLDGATGVEYYRIRNTSMTIAEYAVIADVTGDGQANFVVPGNNRSDLPAGTPGIRVFEANNGRWATARALWNQHHYSINHIEDDGSVPINEMPSWLTHNTFRTAFQGEHPAALPDITLGRVRLIDDGVSIALEARIGSGGLVSPHDHPRLELFDGDPASGGSLLLMQQIQELESGGFIDVRIDDLPLVLANDELHVWINRDQVANECRDNNNFAVLPWEAIIPSGQVQLAINPEEVLRGEPIRLLTDVTNLGRLPAQFQIKWQLIDANGQLLAEIASDELDLLAPQAGFQLAPDWLPLTLIEGNHWIQALLLGPDGRTLDSDQASFTLLAADDESPLAGLSVQPDRATYRRDDQVQLELLAHNRHSALRLTQARIELDVLAPDDSVMHSATLPLGTLNGGQQVWRQHGLGLEHVDVGSYRVEAALFANSSATPLAEASSLFEVLDQVAINGQVNAGWLNDEPFCTDTVRNLSLSALNQLSVRTRLVHFDSESEIEQQILSLDLAPSESTIMQRHFGGELPSGEFLCVLEAWQDEHWQLLGTAAFRIAGSEPTEAGVLMWLEGPAEVSEDGGQTTLALALADAPVESVVVTVSHEQPNEIELDLTDLFFDASNWDQFQLITITGLDDETRDGDQTIWLTGMATSADPRYDQLAAEPVSVVNLDNDLPGIEVSPDTLPEFNDDLIEATVQVRLLNRPFNPVELTLNLTDEQYFEINPTVLHFDIADWEAPRNVVVNLRPVEREETATAWLEFDPAVSADDGYHDMTVAPIELRAAANQGGGPPDPEQPAVPVPLSPWAFYLLIALLYLTAIRQRRLHHV